MVFFEFSTTFLPVLSVSAAKRPGQRIRPAGRVVDGVTERLAEGLALILEGGAELPVLVQGPGRSGRSRLGKPGLAVVDEGGGDAVGQAQPPASLAGRGLGLRVELALIALLPVAQVRHVDEAARIEVRPVVKHLDDVGARARLDGRGDPRLEIVLVDGLEHDVHLHLAAIVGELPLELGLALRDEIHAVEEMKTDRLRERGSLPRGEDARQPRRATSDKFSAVDHVVP